MWRAAVSGFFAACLLLAPSASAAPLWNGSVLADWQSSGGGGLYLSGNASGQNVNAPCRSGPCVELTIAGSGGARLFRWNESYGNRLAVYSAWLYIPQAYDFTGPNGYWNLLQFKSLTTSRNDPIWSVELTQGMLIRGVWNGYLPGPHAGEAATWKAYSPGVTAPVAQWFRLSAVLRQSNTYDGRFQVWLNETLLLDFHDVRTGYVDCRFNAWCVAQHWSVNLYSDGLTPSPAHMYVDDAWISTGTLVCDKQARRLRLCGRRR
jgi:hypothetical protein